MLVALQALLDIWTEPTATCNRDWVPHVPQNVQQTIEYGINFLVNVLGSDTGIKLENAFFSGSDKGSGMFSGILKLL